MLPTLDKSFSEIPFWKSAVGPSEKSWSQLGGNFAALGVSVEHHQYSSPQTIQWHKSFHPHSLEICLNFEGSSSFDTGEQTRNSTGQHLLMYSTAHQPQLRANRLSGNHHFVTLEFAPHTLNHLLEESALSDQNWNSKLLSKPIKMELLPDSSFFLSKKEAPEPSDKAQMIAQAYSILSQCLGSLTQTSPDTLFCHRWQQTAHQRITKAKQYLHTHLEEKLSLKLLSQHVGCSSAYLSRTFTSVEGVTISQYLKQQRMRTAAQLLTEGKMNVTEVSLEVGYNSLSHFSRIFTETYNCCPCAYNISKVE